MKRVVLIFYDFVFLILLPGPYIEQIRLHKGYAFVNFKSHDQAKQVSSSSFFFFCSLLYSGG